MADDPRMFARELAVESPPASGSPQSHDRGRNRCLHAVESSATTRDAETRALGDCRPENAAGDCAARPDRHNERPYFRLIFDREFAISARAVKSKMRTATGRIGFSGHWFSVPFYLLHDSTRW